MPNTIVKPIAKKSILDPSFQRLEMLHPLIRQDAIDAYKEAVRRTPKGVHPVINETYRSYERSNQLYAQGRTKPGPIVTNAPGGSSWHNFALGIDFYLEINGKAVWKVDANLMIVVDCFTKRGFTWGGNFHSIKDYPHFEKSMGLTLAKCRQLYRTGKVDKNGFLII